MTFFQFISICLVTVYGSALLYAVIDKLEKSAPAKESLSSMLSQGEFSCDVPICLQLKSMALNDEVVQIEELDLEFDLVDIERVKRQLSSKNRRLNEIVLEI